MRILTVVGARPQFIKAMAISHEIQRRHGIEEVLLHTGQHYDDNMSKVFFDGLSLPKPKYRFDLGGGSHGQMTGRQLEQIEKALLTERPDICLVYGDTNSTLAGTLAAAKLHIAVAHVEAGLRSFNRKMPEEINRVLTDHASTWLFTPTATAVRNLSNEGIDSRNIHRVGDVMYDVALLFSDKIKDGELLKSLKVASGGYVIATVHRQENTDDPARLEAIMGALADIARKFPVVLPIHPRTRRVALNSSSAVRDMRQLILIDPVDFAHMVTLISNAAVVVTDSGGIQKEAYFHKRPCVTVREETEWVELVDSGWNRLPRAIERDAIVTSVEQALVAPPGADDKPYGDGHAAKAILDVLTQTRS